jgi:hypothetical protein
MRIKFTKLKTILMPVVRCCASSKKTVPLQLDYRLVSLSNTASDINSRAETHRLTQKSRPRASSAPPRSTL